MRISVFGLGYVGAVSAACFARNGHEIIGVDTNLSKVQSFNAGLAPVVETGLDELMADGVNSGRIRATSSVEDAIRHSHVSLLCVGTPSRPQRQPRPELSAAGRPNRSVRRSATKPSVSRRGPSAAPCSRAPPTRWSSPRSNGHPAAERMEMASGVSVNPEFLREGTAAQGFPQTAAHARGPQSRRRQRPAPSAPLSVGADAPLVSTSIRRSRDDEINTSNTWHALKVVFANEIGNLCKKLNGLDSHEVMDIFCL